MTVSQYKAANQLLMRQQRELEKKQQARDRSKNVKEAREQMLKNARGKVMNYAVREGEEDLRDEGGDFDEEPELIAVDEETSNLLMRDGQLAMPQ